ncbi:MAG: ABC transporter permease, partial [Candidatus Eremiobacteraeota bacterium]|nr:ABC transporter permease [Candidatus Eremiobacteraeota bacterium]
MSGVIKIFFNRDMVKFFRQPPRIFGILIMPLFFILVAAYGMSRISVTGNLYQRFVVAGVISHTMMLTINVSSASIIWDREFGFLKVIQVSPASRLFACLGKLFAASVQALFQAMIFLIMLPFLGIKIGFIGYMIATGIIILWSLGYSAMGHFLAFNVDSYEAFHALQGILAVFFIFFSGGYYSLR